MRLRNLLAFMIVACTIAQGSLAFCQSVLAPPPAPDNEDLFSDEDLRRMERERIQSERRVQLLNNAMSKEGLEYSLKKHEEYVRQSIVGIVLTSFGGGSVVFGVAWGFMMLLDGLGSVFSTVGDDGDEEFEDDGEARRVTVHCLIWGGLLGLMTGIPLTVHGVKGKNRQEILREKDSILGELDTVKVGFGFDPESRTGALSLSYAF